MSAGLAAELRAEFDTGFAHLPSSSEDGRVDVLLLCVGEQERAIRLTDVAEVVSRPSLTPVPTRVPALVGLGASRGTAIAAYDLALLTGGQRQEPRWLLVLAADSGLGLVVSGLVGYRHLFVADGRMIPSGDRSDQGNQGGRVDQGGRDLRSGREGPAERDRRKRQAHLLDVPSLLDTIGQFALIPPTGNDLEPSR